MPAGVTDIRLAKYFPYTVSQKDAWQASIAGHPRVRSVKFLGSSRQGRPIEMIEITDSSVPDSSKHRVWIHAAVHPSETTSYFTVEGLVGFLLSGSPASELLLDHLIVDVVPMTNPDGVFLGNYRTNSRSVNLENQWTAPYNSTEREIVALRTQIEALMGTPASPGNNPIEVLLNLHSSHNVAFPFHFEHVANASFNLVSNRTGVIPSVNAKEKKWIAAFVNQSPLVARGSTMSSTLGARLESLSTSITRSAPSQNFRVQRSKFALFMKTTSGSRNLSAQSRTGNGAIVALPPTPAARVFNAWIRKNTIA